MTEQKNEGATGMEEFSMYAKNARIEAQAQETKAARWRGKSIAFAEAGANLDLAKWLADPLAGFFDDLLKDNLPSGDKDFIDGLEGMKRRCEIMAKASNNGARQLGQAALMAMDIGTDASKMAQELNGKADYYEEQEKMGAPCPHTNFVRLGYLGPFMTGISSTKIHWACCRHCHQFFATSIEDAKANNNGARQA